MIILQNGIARQDSQFQCVQEEFMIDNIVIVKPKYTPYNKKKAVLRKRTQWFRSNWSKRKVNQLQRAGIARGLSARTLDSKASLQKDHSSNHGKQTTYLRIYITFRSMIHLDSHSFHCYVFPHIATNWPR